MQIIYWKISIRMWRLINLIDKLVFECEDKVFNTTDTISITDRKVTCKNNCLIYIILLAIMCLILETFVSISCCCCYSRCWLKKEYPIPY